MSLKSLDRCAIKQVLAVFPCHEYLVIPLCSFNSEVVTCVTCIGENYFTLQMVKIRRGGDAVLIDKHRLKQGCPCCLAMRLHSFHKTLERNIFVGECAEHGLTNAVDQLCHCRIILQTDP